jgi:ferritin-like metal-binding protein YciE
MAKSTHEKLVSYLKAAHALEQTSLQMTQAAAMATKDPQMRELFQHHHEETQEHERLIRQRIEAHGETVSEARDLGGRLAALAKGAGAMEHWQGTADAVDTIPAIRAPVASDRTE